MLQAVNTEFFNPLVAKAHNCLCKIVERMKVTFHGRNLLTCCLFKKQSQKAKNIGFPDFHAYNFVETFRAFTHTYPQKYSISFTN